MICDYCTYRNSWDCGDGYNRRRNCSEFKLDWDMVSDEDKDVIKRLLDKEDEYTDWY